MTRILMALMILCVLPVSAQAGSRADIREMRDKTLTRLYKESPHAREEIRDAAGYAVFSSGGLNVVFFSAAYGSGIAHDSKSGQETYMKMASGGVGLGLGVKDYRLVFIFHTRRAFDRFIEQGWDFSGQADAAAKAGTDGAELSEAADVMPGTSIYQLTENGLALQATVQGTKYWKDRDLND